MHIRLFLLALLLVRTQFASAQPILTSYNISPLVGNEVTYRSTGYYAPGDSGAGRFWDFSMLQASSSSFAEVTECIKSPHCGSFPGSNTVSRLQTNIIDYFYNSQPDSLTLVGLWHYRLAAAYEFYTNPRTVFTFPFTYGSSFVDSFRAFLQQPGASMDYFGNDSVLADGWGSVRIGAKTISNVLRIKKITTTHGVVTDSVHSKTNNHKSKELAYYWYVPYYHEYILYMSEIFSDFPNSPPHATYGGYTTSPEGPLVVQPLENKPAYILQNPAHGTLRLELSTSAKADIAYRITDMQGRYLKYGVWSRGQGSTIELSLAHVPSGIYCLSITDNNGSHTERFVVE
jgi:hypothetical protein